MKRFRYILFPISLLYGAVIWFRNWLFDIKLLRASTFNFPIICVGNIAVGGTGKTPMVEYLVRLLQQDFNTATLSRGYKRKTKGFAIADATTTALEIGDEPMQFHKKFPTITVAVGEERIVAIPQLLHDKPATHVIILDDAFQHRQVDAGLNIVLTAYNNLFTRDLMLPAGDLRDVKASMKRADIIIVTKCKSDCSEVEKTAVIKEINPKPNQAVFFTSIAYGNPYHLFTNQPITTIKDTAALLVCGIANPQPLKEFLATQFNNYEMLTYADHHIFHSEDLAAIKKHFDKLPGDNKIILTTEKDAVRLVKFEEQLKDFPLYVLPIEHRFLFNESGSFDQLVTSFIASYKK